MSVVGGRRPVSHRSNHKPPFRCSVRQDAQRRSAPGLAGSFATVHESGSKMEKATAGTTASGMRHRPWLSKRPRGQGSPEKVHSDRTASTVVRDGLFQDRPSGFRGIPPQRSQRPIPSTFGTGPESSRIGLRGQEASHRRDRARLRPVLALLIHVEAGAYWSSTSPPASSICALRSSASSRETPSLTGFGASSTSDLASLRPMPVMERTSLIT